MLGYLVHPTRALELARHRHGPSFSWTTPFGRELVVTRPDDVAQVLGDGSRFLAGAANQAIRSMVGARSVSSLDGQEHLERRRVGSSIFGRDTSSRITLQTIDDLHRAFESASAGGPVSMASIARGVFVEVLATLVLGDAVSRSARDRFVRSIRRYGRAAALPLSQLAMLPLLQPLSARLAHTRDPRDAIRAELRSAPKREGRSLIQTLGRAGLDEAAILDDAVTYVGAGYDTTASAFAWLVSLLAHDRDRWTGLARVARQRSPDSALDWPELGHAVEETLRLFPPIPQVSRIVADPVSMAGHRLQPGDRITASLYLAHRDRDAFPDPDRFRPQRCARSTMPFGGGAHRCPGRHLATALLQVSLFSLLRAFDVEPLLPAWPVWRGTTLSPLGGLVAKLRPTTHAPPPACYRDSL